MAFIDDATKLAKVRWPHEPFMAEFLNNDRERFWVRVQESIVEDLLWQGIEPATAKIKYFDGSCKTDSIVDASPKLF